MGTLAKVHPLHPSEQKKKTPHPLNKKLNILNENKRIKLRVNKTDTGKYSFYLEYVNKGKRERTYLKLYYINKAGTKAEDKKAYKDAVDARDVKEDDYRRNKHGFILENDNLDIVFLDYYEGLVKKRSDSKSAKKDLSWNNTLLHLKIFSKLKAKRETTFYFIDEKYCEAFKEYLLNSPRIKSLNTAHMYLAKLKAALNIAIIEKIITVNPAQNIKIDKQDTYTENLTIEEIRLLYETPCMSEQTKRAFIFSCFTGLRISDVKKLTWDEIRENHILYKSKKTKKYEKMKIHTRALKILTEQRAYHKEKKIPSEIVFNLVSDVHTNKHIKRWAIDAGISKKVTWHVGRHTFAQLNVSSEVDIYTISNLLGHSSVEVTQKYLKQENQNKDKAIDKIPDI